MSSNLYSYIYPKLKESRCNYCSLDAIHSITKNPVRIYANICGDHQLDAAAFPLNSNGTVGNKIWSKVIDTNCQPEDCPFTNFKDLDCTTINARP